MRRHERSGDGTSGPGRLDNGLHASKYVPLTDVDSSVGQQLLTALGRARIAAYLDSSAEREDRQRLFVASDDRVDARTIVAAAVRTMGRDDSSDGSAASGWPDRRDPDDDTDTDTDIDTDAAFRELIADWHVDTVAAVRAAERDLTREDTDWRARLGQPQASDEVWLDEDHYVPPPPPPLPRLSRPTIAAIVIGVLAIVTLAFGVSLGLPGDFTLVLGCGGLVATACILFTRIREYRRDDDDDGSAI